MDVEEEITALPEDISKLNCSTWRCHCGLIFKRRGMMVNHVLRQHPNMTLTTACPELHKPLLRPATRFHCPRCSKVYRSRSKLKQHILKRHPGHSLPPKGIDHNESNNLTSCAGIVAISVSQCPANECKKQYATRAKLIQHVRIKHPYIHPILLNSSVTIFDFEDGTGKVNSPDIVLEEEGDTEKLTNSLISSDALLGGDNETGEANIELEKSMVGVKKDSYLLLSNLENRLQNDTVVEKITKDQSSQIEPKMAFEENCNILSSKEEQLSLTSNASSELICSSKADNVYQPTFEGLQIPSDNLPDRTAFLNSITDTIMCESRITSNHTMIVQKKTSDQHDFSPDCGTDVETLTTNIEDQNVQEHSVLELVEEYLEENSVFDNMSYDLSSMTLNEELNKETYINADNVDNSTWSTNDSSLIPHKTFDLIVTTKSTQDHRLSGQNADFKKKTYKCQNCDQSFSRNSSLKWHSAEMHTPKEPTVRKKLKRSSRRAKKSTNNIFINNSRKSSEMSASKADSKKIGRNYFKFNIGNLSDENVTHPCTSCPSTFSTKSKLKMHMLRHSDYREFTCSICTKQFKRKDKYKKHVKLKHSLNKLEETKGEPTSKSMNHKANKNDGFWHCQCGAAFKRRGMMVNHVWRQHPSMATDSACPALHQPLMKSATRFHCSLCSKVYLSSAKRKQHMLKKHPGCSLPPTTRNKHEPDVDTLTTNAGKVVVNVSRCPVEQCHKQYATRAKLIQHIRHKHSNYLQVTKNSYEDKKSSDDQLCLSSEKYKNESNHQPVLEIFSQEDSLDDDFSNDSIDRSILYVQNENGHCSPAPSTSKLSNFCHKNDYENDSNIDSPDNTIDCDNRAHPVPVSLFNILNDTNTTRENSKFHLFLQSNFQAIVVDHNLLHDEQCEMDAV